MKKFELKLRKLLSGQFYWYFQSIFKWEGMEIEDIRPYQIWDDIRKINWKLTAKFSKIFINIFREERDVDMHIFLDINYNWKNYNKQIIDIFLDIWIFARRYGANITTFLQDKKPQKIWRDLTKLYWMSKIINETINSAKPKYKSYLTQFLLLEKKIYKRHVLLIFSDFLDLIMEDIKLLKIFLEKNEIYLFKIPIWFFGKNYTQFDIDNSNNIDLYKNFPKERIFDLKNIS